MALVDNNDLHRDNKHNNSERLFNLKLKLVKMMLLFSYYHPGNSRMIMMMILIVMTMLPLVNVKAVYSKTSGKILYFFFFKYALSS